jgi:hypothetical protein
LRLGRLADIALIGNLDDIDRRVRFNDGNGVQPAQCSSRSQLAVLAAAADCVR